jgi:hypothetical protein
MAKTNRDLREASRRWVGEWVEDGYRPCNEQIRTGALCRIADALEKIVVCQDRLASHQVDHTTMKNSIQNLRAEIKKIKALKGKE